MSEERVSALDDMLSGMSLKLDEQAYTFAILGHDEQPPELAFALIREDEGTTVILPIGKGPLFARITLQVHSDLEGVGLTAAVSSALAKAGIACNVIAAFHHDHLFVPWERRDEALGVLERLSSDVAGP